MGLRLLFHTAEILRFTLSPELQAFKLAIRTNYPEEGKPFTRTSFRELPLYVGCCLVALGFIYFCYTYKDWILPKQPKYSYACPPKLQIRFVF